MCSYTKGITATSILRDFDEISTILMQHRPQNQEYRPFKQNGRLSTNGRYRPYGRPEKSFPIA